MPNPARPPAYTAEIRPFPLHHPALNRVRLSGRQGTALAGLTAVPIVIDGTSSETPCAQAETALQDAAFGALGREACAVLRRPWWGRWFKRAAMTRGGELHVLCGGGFVQVANIELTPARVAERAVA